MVIPSQKFDIMHVIYKINFSNGKVYIGQTNDFTARRNQHLSDAKKGEDYKIYRAMRKYNTTKDDFEIIESDLNSQDLANDREIYWIAFYDSYHNGYNSTPGGQTGSYCLGEKSHFAKLTEEDVINIRRIRYTKKYQRSEIWELYKERISESAFGKIWNYESWKHVLPELNSEELRTFYRQLRKNAKGDKNGRSRFTNEEVYELRVLFYVEAMPFQELLEKYGKGVNRTSLQKLLYGKNYKEVAMPEKSEKWRKENKHPLPEEIQELRNKYSSGIPIKELKTGFFENYTEAAIRNIVTYKTYNNI